MVAAHGKNEGYFIATDYDTDPNADISLIPAGYWYEIGYIDDKPIEYNASMKLYHNVMTGNVLNKLKAGASFSSVGNKGIGTYYDDPRYTPTWRSYPYNEIQSERTGGGDTG